MSHRNSASPIYKAEKLQGKKKDTPYSLSVMFLPVALRKIETTAKKYIILTSASHK